MMWMCTHGELYDMNDLNAEKDAYTNRVIDTYTDVHLDLRRMTETMRDIRNRLSRSIEESNTDEFHECQFMGDILAKEIRDQENKRDSYEQKLKAIFESSKPERDETLDDPYYY
jgi:hypothetical protein